tara:strand:- start:675 stop:1760 length:1086 start_codon:yes stop_codon:yes gene_type:complete
LGYFKNINLINFRNFEKLNLDFSKDCNVFFGNNGSGKTNLLEAISIFSKGKGLRNDKLSNLIKKEKKKFILAANFDYDDITYSLLSESYETNNRVKKKITVNKDESKESLDNLYKLAPFIFFLPETERLFLSSPNNRRNIIDRFIFNHNTSYNKIINQYNKNLIERSKLLSNDNFDINWLNRIEENISNFGLQIYLLRNEQNKVLIDNLNYFLKKFKLPYNVDIEIRDKFFNSKVSDEIFINELKTNRKIDALFGGSKIGPHKSDFIFTINKDFLASQLSTGQQKTIILLLFLSQCRFLNEIFNQKPILLLDEVCSHLDEINRKILLTLIEGFGSQIFMTGTTKNLFSFLSTNTNFCNITN